MSIPPPPSALRKPSYRPSLVPQATSRHSTAPRQSIAAAPSRAQQQQQQQNGGSTARGSENTRQSIAPSRKSILPMGNQAGNTSMRGIHPPPSARKQQHQHQRQSSFGTGAASYSTAMSHSGNNRDPRPLRDREYINNLFTEIHQYLADNAFEIEMKHPLTQKTLKQPTQKDFVMMFQFLYKKLDPGYRFTKSIEHEVYTLLRAIHYPYIDSINKSSISAVGGQNSWPVFVGMLYWLVQLNLTLERYDQRDFESIEEESEDDVLDQIFTRYVTKSYRAFLANEDDYSEYKAEMDEEFVQYTSGVQETISNMEQENEQMKVKMQELGKEADHLAALEERGNALKSDVGKFQQYIDQMENRKAKWNGVLEKINEQLHSYEEELKQLEEEKQTLQSQITAQGLTPSDIDRMNAEKEKLSKALEHVGSRLEEATRLFHEKELGCQRALESLEQTLQQYSSKLYQVGLRGGENNYEVSLDNPMNSENLGKKPEELLKNKDLRRQVKPELQQYRNQIHERIGKSQEEGLRLQELSDRAQETVNEFTDQKETLSAQLNTSKMTYAELYETIQSDASASNADVEKLERQIKHMKASAEQGLFQLTQRSQSVKIEYDEMKHAVEEARDRMNNEVEKMISSVINFKLHIQSSLEDYENFVIDEYQRDE